MSLLDERRAQMSPRLTDAQLERVAAYGTRRAVRRGDTLYEKGQVNRPWFVAVTATAATAAYGAENDRFPNIEPRQFTGEFDHLTGRASIYRGVVAADGEVIELTNEQLRRLLQEDPELSELVMRAFILRRMAALEKGWGNVVLVGSRFSADTLRLKQFLTRNGEPYSALDVDTEPQVQEVLDRFRVSAADVPVVICYGKNVLRNPSNDALAACLGWDGAFDSEIGRAHV